MHNYKYLALRKKMQELLQLICYTKYSQIISLK